MADAPHPDAAVGAPAARRGEPARRGKYFRPRTPRPERREPSAARAAAAARARASATGEGGDDADAGPARARRAKTRREKGKRGGDVFVIRGGPRIQRERCLFSGVPRLSFVRESGGRREDRRRDRRGERDAHRAERSRTRKTRFRSGSGSGSVRVPVRRRFPRKRRRKRREKLGARFVSRLVGIRPSRDAVPGQTRGARDPPEGERARGALRGGCAVGRTQRRLRGEGGRLGVRLRGGHRVAIVAFERKPRRKSLETGTAAERAPVPRAASAAEIERRTRRVEERRVTNAASRLGRPRAYRGVRVVLGVFDGVREGRRDVSGR
mmetsp:Transcript_15745/g.66330  ORF Transcript_15745/g.66330 Transcript_15745/m.66330 type:complete len:324 (-) Transcript_15745:1593-2564(-)